MADPKAPQPQAQPNPAELQEAQRKLDAVRGALVKGVGQAKSYLESFAQAVRERLDQAELEAAKALEMVEALEPHLAHPGAVDLQMRMNLRHRAEAAYAALLKLELDADHEAIAELAKLPALESPTAADAPNLRIAQHEPGYRRAAIEQDLALASYHLFRQRHVFEVIRRAAGQEHLLPEDDPVPFQQLLGAAEARDAAVKSLREAMKADPNAFALVGQFATQLEEAEALAAWGEEAVRSLASLPPEALLRSLDDPDWRKLNGAVVALGGMAERAAECAPLAALLPVPIGADMPPPASPLPEGAPKPSNLLVGLG